MPLYKEGSGIIEVIFAIIVVCNFAILFKNGQVQQTQLYYTLYCRDVVALLLRIFWSKFWYCFVGD